MLGTSGCWFGSSSSGPDAAMRRSEASMVYPVLSPASIHHRFSRGHVYCNHRIHSGRGAKIPTINQIELPSGTFRSRFDHFTRLFCDVHIFGASAVTFSPLSSFRIYRSHPFSGRATTSSCSALALLSSDMRYNGVTGNPLPLNRCLAASIFRTSGKTFGSVKSWQNPFRFFK